MTAIRHVLIEFADREKKGKHYFGVRTFNFQSTDYARMFARKGRTNIVRWQGFTSLKKLVKPQCQSVHKGS